MTEQAGKFRTIILAGERPGGSPISHAFNCPASVMVPVAGKPALARVIQAVSDSHLASGGVICGPSADIVANSEAIRTLLSQPDFEWLDQSTGPAASAVSALEKLDYFPALLTAGDHALLTGKIVDNFCQQVLAKSPRQSVNIDNTPVSDTQVPRTSTSRTSISRGASDYDLIIGFVPYSLVQATWPESKRTVLKFSDGQFCGSNLFAVLNIEGRKALSFWQQAEADRKQPWRIARRFGIVALLKYLFRRVSLEETLQGLSMAAGCRIGYVQLDFARAAVDVDSVEDQKLAEEILSEIERSY